MIAKKNDLILRNFNRARNDWQKWIFRFSTFDEMNLTEAYPDLQLFFCETLNFWKGDIDFYFRCETIRLELSRFGRLQANNLEIWIYCYRMRSFNVNGKCIKNSLKVVKDKLWVNCTNQKCLEFRIRHPPKQNWCLWKCFAGS